jgi:hypothetical protein
LISTFELNYELSEEMNAEVLKQTTISGDSSVSLPVYINTVMANITKGTPEQKILKTVGSGVFKNGNRTPALTSQVLKEQNYITASIYKDSNADDVSKTTEAITSYLKSHIDSDVQTISSKSIKYVINKGSDVRVEFLNGKLSKLAFSITNSSGSVKSLQ